MDGQPAYEWALDESRIFEKLPNELVELICAASGSQYLDALAVGALKPRCTEGFFNLYEPIFVDLAARWLQPYSSLSQGDILSAFARVLPLAPYLRSFASQFALSHAGSLSAFSVPRDPTELRLGVPSTRTLLLAMFRLLSFDLEVFSKAISPSQIQLLFLHPDRSIRYVAVRCFALYMHAADAATENMVKRIVGDEPIEGEWEGIMIDYRCLCLWEERRWETLEKQIRQARSSRSTEQCFAQAEKLQDYFTARTAAVCGVLIPKLHEAPIPLSSIVRTPTAVENLRRISMALLAPQPILLVGLPNSGKSSLVNDVAATMGQSESGGFKL